MGSEVLEQTLTTPTDRAAAFVLLAATGGWADTQRRPVNVRCCLEL